jgi:hypothetical protein
MMLGRRRNKNIHEIPVMQGGALVKVIISRQEDGYGVGVRTPETTDRGGTVFFDLVIAYRVAMAAAVALKGNSKLVIDAQALRNLYLAIMAQMGQMENGHVSEAVGFARRAIGERGLLLIAGLDLPDTLCKIVQEAATAAQATSRNQRRGRRRR